jgi:hypothetical protein
MDKKIFNRYGYENISIHILPYLWTALEETVPDFPLTVPIGWGLCLIYKRYKLHTFFSPVINDFS